MALKSCPKCGQNISTQAKKCPQCGEDIQVCLECGSLMSANAENCSICGCPFSIQEGEVTQKPTPNTSNEKYDFKKVLTEWKNSSNFTKFAFNFWQPFRTIHTILFLIGELIFLIVMIVLVIQTISKTTSGLEILENFKLLTIGFLVTIAGATIVASCEGIIEYVKYLNLMEWLKKEGYNSHETAKAAIKEITLDEFVSPKKRPSWVKTPAYYIAEACYFNSTPEPAEYFKKATSIHNCLYPIFSVLGDVSLSIVLFLSYKMLLLSVTSINSIAEVNIAYFFLMFILVFVGKLTPFIIKIVTEEKLKERKRLWATQLFSKEGASS